MSIDETAMLLSGQMVRNDLGTFYFDQPGSWIDSAGAPIYHRLHRADGAAAIYASGAEVWCVDGKLHRLDGPAVTYSTGQRQWYINGEFIK